MNRIYYIVLVSLFELLYGATSDNTSHVHHSGTTVAPWGTDEASHFLLSGLQITSYRYECDATGYTQEDTCHVCYQPHQISSLTANETGSGTGHRMQHRLN